MQDLYTLAISQGFKLAWGVLGVALLAGMIWFTLRHYGFDFRDKVVPELEKDAKASAHFLGLLFIACAILIVGLLGGCAAQAKVFPDRYDRQIRTAAATWLPGVPWKLWKAQLYQESRLDPFARSPAGAEGLAQFMPATWREITTVMGLGLVDRSMAEPSIHAGAYYMARLRRQWSAPRPETDRHDLAMASYNAGIGHLLAAQKACGGRALYREIIACLPAITGHHAAETMGYAPAIRRWHLLMEAG